MRSRFLLAMILLIAALTLSACGGDESPTPTPVPPTATSVPATATPVPPTATPVPPTATPVPPAPTEVPAAEPAAAQPASPLGQPESPLGQPESPLPVPAQSAAPAAPISGYEAIAQMASQLKGPVPQPGMAALSGVLYSAAVDRVIPGTTFFLTPAVKDGDRLVPPGLISGPEVQNGDVQGMTNDLGQIVLDNVPPGDYYLPVWTVYNWPFASISPDLNPPVLVQVKAGDQLDLGLLYVEWP